MSRQVWQGRGFTTSRLHEDTGLHQSGTNFNSGDQPTIEEPFKLHRKMGMWHMSHLLTIIVEGANKCRRIVTGNIWKSYMCTAVKKWDISNPRSYVHYWTSNWNETWKNSGSIRFEPMTSAIPVQRSTNWAIELRKRSSYCINFRLSLRVYSTCALLAKNRVGK